MTLPRLLIVDRNAALNETLVSILSVDYETVGVINSAQALTELRTKRFAILLIDLSAPGDDGIELLQRIQSFDPELVAIAMVEDDGHFSASAALETGVFDVLVKPFKANDIRIALWRALYVQQLQAKSNELKRQHAAHIAALEESNTHLEAANQELEAFSHSVSHDLRARLNTLSSLSKTLQQEHAGQLGPEARYLCSQILNTSERMHQIVEDLLRLSRVHQQPLSPRIVDMGLLVNEVIQELRPAYSGARFEFRIGALPEARGDSGLIRQLWFNLLSNAVKFTRDRPAPLIEVGCEHSGNANVYYVRDNGIGFDEQQAQRLFVAFQRLHGAEFEGTGIGLSIARRIVTRHGGRIWAESRTNHGATFRFQLHSL